MKNRTLRISLILAILTLVTSCFMGSTFAKYVTTDSEFDTARVAKWGVTVDVVLGDLNAQYETDDGTYTGTYSVEATENVVAPGTSGVIMTAAIAGTPEVAVDVAYNFVVDFGDNWLDENGDYYCPITIIIDGVEYAGNNYTSVTEFEDELKAALNDLSGKYASQTPINANHTVRWAWAFTGGVGQTDTSDTYLGDQAAAGTKVPAFTFSLGITVTQID